MRVKVVFLVLVLIAGGALVFWHFSPREAPPVVVSPPGELEVEEVKEGVSEVKLQKVGESVLLPPTAQVYQTWNNCGPATVSMILSFYGIQKSQAEIGQDLRPYQNPRGDNDDKTIFPEEFSEYVKQFGLESLYRVGGDRELLKKLLANGLPVVVKQWLHLGEDIGHFRIVRGFNISKKVFITDDSYDGPNRRISFSDFEKLWQPFNYGYILVYPSESKEIVEAILAEAIDPQAAYQKAVERAERGSNYFNLATSFYHLGKYQKSIAAFEKIEKRLPPRMLWYQIEPILAYQKLGEFDRVFALTDKVLNGGNNAFSELYQIRGEVFSALGEKEKARVEFEKAVKYNVNYEN